MKLPDGTLIDLDAIETTLTKLFEHAMKLAGETWRLGVERGVPERYLRKYAPMPGEADVKLLPVVYTEFVEFEGEIWHHGDTDYTSTAISREVLEGTKTVEQFVEEMYAYAMEQEQIALRLAEAEEAAKDARAREARRRNYEALKLEFEGPAKQQSTHDEWTS